MKLLRKLFEREMSSEEMGEETKLHKKIPMSSFVKQYGKERGKKIYYATVKRMAIKENNNSSEDSVIVEKEGKKKKSRKSILKTLKMVQNNDILIKKYKKENEKKSI